MEESRYLNPIRPQPFDGGSGTHYNGLHEFVDYLPGTSMRFWYTSNSEGFKEHWHDATEIITCERGNYQATIENAQYQILPGDILIIPGGLVHTLSPQNDCRGFVHLIDFAPIKKIKSSIALQALLTQPTFISHIEDTNLSQSANILINQMELEYFSNNDLRELLVYSHLIQLLMNISQSQLLTTQQSIHINRNTQKEYEDTFKQVLNYLSMHYDEDITLDQIAKQYGFSKYHFSRLFNKYTSNNFCDYLAYQRISAAKSMLIHSSLPITEISDKSGFNSLSTFNRVFKDKTGYNPSTYRQLYAQA